MVPAHITVVRKFQRESLKRVRSNDATSSQPLFENEEKRKYNDKSSNLEMLNPRTHRLKKSENKNLFTLFTYTEGID
jgi:hypothetical protein